MEVEPPNPEISPPAAFLGDFAGYIEKVREELEAHYGDDAGQFTSVPERAEAEAPFIAARNWLVERWGEHFPCPVCKNVEWMVSGVGPAIRPPGFLSFSVTCGYCANTMQVIPGYAELQAPRLPDQLQFPAPER
jgi:hypothetical protein